MRYAAERGAEEPTEAGGWEAPSPACGESNDSSSDDVELKQLAVKQLADMTRPLRHASYK